MGPYMACFGGDYGETYLHTYMAKQNVSFAKVAVPYTLLRKPGPACTRITLYPVHPSHQVRLMWRAGCMNEFCVGATNTSRFNVTVEHKIFVLACHLNGTIAFDASGELKEGGRRRITSMEL